MRGEVRGEDGSPRRYGVTTCPPVCREANHAVLSVSSASPPGHPESLRVLVFDDAKQRGILKHSRPF